MDDPLKQAKAKAAAAYDAASDHFDDAPLSFWDRIGRRTVEGLALPFGGNVLDVGCGTGASALPAARVVGPNGFVIGVDLAARLLDRARDKAKALGSIVKIDDTWWILLKASETKEKRADERPIEDDDIGNAIDKYLKFYRPILAGRGDNTNALWLAINGDAMAQCSVSEVITDTTRSTLGVAISPHLFRTAAAATAAIHAGDKPHLASALLHHSHPTVTLENYNRASSISAGRAYRNVIERFRSINV